MTTTTAELAPARPRQPVGRRMGNALTDIWTLAYRSLLLWARVPAYLMFTLVQPVMFVLLFRFVFGGAIPVENQGGYVEFLIPGIIGQSAAFASFSTAIALAREIQKGSIDRFRSMPIARSAVLAGRLSADTIRLIITVLVLVAVGYVVGFRFHNGFVPAVGMIGLAVVFGVVTCLISAFIGLAIKDEESVQAFGFIWLFPLTFVSSAFVPVYTLPGWLQGFAKNQPVTIIINEMRHLALGGPLVHDGWLSAAWLAAITAVFAPLAVRAYRKV